MENVNYKFAGIDVGFYNEYYSNSRQTVCHISENH